MRLIRHDALGGAGEVAVEDRVQQPAKKEHKQVPGAFSFVLGSALRYTNWYVVVVHFALGVAFLHLFSPKTKRRAQHLLEINKQP